MPSEMITEKQMRAIDAAAEALNRSRASILEEAIDYGLALMEKLYYWQLQKYLSQIEERLGW